MTLMSNDQGRADDKVVENNVVDFVDLDLLREIEKLDAAIASRRLANASPEATDALKRDLEKEICISSRTLYSRFVDSFLWGGLKEHNIAGVGEKIRDALGAISLDEKCAESVRRRLEDFFQFTDRKAG